MCVYQTSNDLLLAWSYGPCQAIALIFLLLDTSKKKRRSQHVKDQVESTLKVSQDTISLQEDGTEVLQEEEATSTKPVPEGTEDPLGIINSTHYNQDNTPPYPQNTLL